MFSTKILALSWHSCVLCQNCEWIDGQLSVRQCQNESGFNYIKLDFISLRLRVYTWIDTTDHLMNCYLFVFWSPAKQSSKWLLNFTMQNLSLVLNSARQKMVLYNLIVVGSLAYLMTYFSIPNKSYQNFFIQITKLFDNSSFFAQTINSPILSCSDHLSLNLWLPSIPVAKLRLLIWKK